MLSGVEFHNVLEKEPVPIFRSLSSSSVGSHMKSSHIWQNRPPLCESTSTSVSVCCERGIAASYRTCVLSSVHAMSAPEWCMLWDTAGTESLA